jgi:hypothetical protein
LGEDVSGDPGFGEQEIAEIKKQKAESKKFKADQASFDLLENLNLKPT